MSGRRSRNKGAAGEREFLRALGDELGESLQRNLVQSRDGGADCIQLRGWAIEVKRCEQMRRPTWWRQAQAAAEALGVQPMLAYRRNREPWRIWAQWPGATVREMGVIEAADAIREKWSMWP